MSTARKLILNPVGYPKHFAMTVDRTWRVRRGAAPKDGKRLHKIERWNKDSERELCVVYKGNFLGLLEKLEDLMGQKVNLYKEYNGHMVRICGEYNIPPDDTRTYDEYLKDLTGKAA